MRLFSTIWGLMSLDSDTTHKLSRDSAVEFKAALFLIFPPLVTAIFSCYQYAGYLPSISFFVPLLPAIYILSFTVAISFIAGTFFSHTVNFFVIFRLLAFVQILEWFRNGFLIYAFYQGSGGFATTLWLMSILTIFITIFYAYNFVTREFGMGDQDAMMAISLSAFVVIIVRFIMEKMIFVDLVDKVLPVI